MKHRTFNCDECVIDDAIYFIRRFFCFCQGIFLTKMIYLDKTIATTSDYFLNNKSKIPVRREKKKIKNLIGVKA